MPTILFFAALILALPTYGLSLLAYVAYLMVRGVTRANARMRYADERAAVRETAATATHSDRRVTKDNADQIALQLIQAGLREGVPASFTTLMMSHPKIGAAFGSFMRTIDDGVLSISDMVSLASSNLAAHYTALTGPQKQEFVKADDAARTGRDYSLDLSLAASVDVMLYRNYDVELD